MNPHDVLVYLEAAGAAGIIGNGAYGAVTGLAHWMREKLGWCGNDLDRPPTDAELGDLVVLFSRAQEQWMPPSAGPTAIQNISIGRDMNAPATNQAGTSE